MKTLAILGAIVAVTAALSAQAQTAPPMPDHPMTQKEWQDAWEVAQQAQKDATEALRKANAAILLLQRSPGSPSTIIEKPISATILEGADKRRGHSESDPVLLKELPPRPDHMPGCDSWGIAPYVLKTDGTGKQKKESGWDSDEDTNNGINAFAYHCLGLLRASDYEDTSNLSAQLSESKGSEQIQLAITQTYRSFKRTKKGKDDAYAPVYSRFLAGGFGHTGSSGDAPLIDLTTSNFASGVGLVGSFEWGRMPAKTESEWEDSIRSGLAKARRDCLANYTIGDPLAAKSDSTDPAQLELDPLAQCRGNNLVQWMLEHGRANQYWKAIVGPMWGFDQTPLLFGGVEFRYAFQDVTYRPVIDPMTGATTATTLPAPVTIHPKPFSLKLYGGITRELPTYDAFKATAGITASLSYRREVDFVDGTSKTVCTPAAPGATFETCSSDQKLAAPYDTKGFVAGLEFNLQSKHFWYLPPLAVAPRLTYAFDTRRLGVEVPLFLLTDDTGKSNSGISYTCRFRGTTPEGFELKKTCGINLFVGTSFDIRGTP